MRSVQTVSGCSHSKFKVQAGEKSTFRDFLNAPPLKLSALVSWQSGCRSSRFSGLKNEIEVQLTRVIFAKIGKHQYLLREKCQITGAKVCSRRSSRSIPRI
jgi:hypothetical protein